MKLPTLDEFITSCANYPLIPSSSYVSFPNFKSLYVRYGPRYIPYVDDQKKMNVFTISNMTAKKSNSGMIIKLLSHMIENHPQTTYFIIESVLNERLQSKCKRMKFNLFGDDYPPTYYASYNEVKEMIKERRE